jgi:hypothetical protein
MRWLAIAHHLPGRTRLRTPVLRKDPPACERIADTLAAIPGVRDVKVRPYTGSMLIEHDEKLAIGTLVEATRAALAIDRVLAAGERPPLEAEVPPFSSIARKLVIAVRELDRDIRRGSDGTVDLGMLATLGFLGAGAAEVVASGKLPLPPWFNLAWWGFRTFMTTEQPEIHADDRHGEGPNAGGE